MEVAEEDMGNSPLEIQVKLAKPNQLPSKRYG